MFSALHEFLVDDLAGIVFSSLDMYRFLDYRVRPAPQGFSSAVLIQNQWVRGDRYDRLQLTWHGTVLAGISERCGER